MFPNRKARSLKLTLAVVGIVTLCFGGIVALGSEGAGPGGEVAHAYDNLLRLHVLAHSDYPEDQRVKLLVRDALIQEMSTWPVPGGREELEALIESRKTRLEAVAIEVLRSEGHAWPVRIEVGSYLFPAKSSPEMALPAGEYRAVRAIIGDGAGENWWCVLFPPLCFAHEGTTKVPAEAGIGEHLLESAEVGQAEVGPAGSAAPTKVAWRLRLWESLTESVYADALRGLIDVALQRD